MKTTAQLLSLFLGAFFWPISIFIIILKSGLPPNKQIILFPLLLLCQVGIPFGYIYIAYKRKIISDLDISKREERYKALFATFISLLVSLFLTYFFGNQLLFQLGLLFVLILIINGFITLFWKISLHMTLNIVASIIIDYLFHWKLPMIFISIPLIFWSRLVLKKHTVWQLLAAFLLNGAVTVIFIRFL